jgi:HAD superfamily hydrolase (TIGR01450 family)
MTWPKLAIFDLDGTLYRGAEAVPGAAEAVGFLLAHGCRVRYLTNNSAAEPTGVSDKLSSLGIPCQPDWVTSTGTAAVAASVARSAKSAFVVGEPTLHSMMRAVGIDTGNEGSDLIVTGICRSMTYELMERALQPLLRGAYWIATNRDGTYPLEKGRMQPGAGAIVAFLAAASGREPDLVLGKPEPEIALDLCRAEEVDPSEALMIGDRWDTDILCGARAGCPTWMVLTGVTSSLPDGQPGSDDLSGLVAALRGL